MGRLATVSRASGTPSDIPIGGCSSRSSLLALLLALHLLDSLRLVNAFEICLRFFAR